MLTIVCCCDNIDTTKTFGGAIIVSFPTGLGVAFGHSSPIGTKKLCPRLASQLGQLIIDLNTRTSGISPAGIITFQTAPSLLSLIPVPTISLYHQFRSHVSVTNGLVAELPSPPSFYFREFRECHNLTYGAVACVGQICARGCFCSGAYPNSLQCCCLHFEILK